MRGESFEDLDVLYLVGQY